MVQYQDDEDADLLQHLPACMTFIEAALAAPGARLLVHCQAGKLAGAHPRVLLAVLVCLKCGPSRRLAGCCIATLDDVAMSTRLLQQRSVVLKQQRNDLAEPVPCLTSHPRHTVSCRPAPPCRHIAQRQRGCSPPDALPGRQRAGGRGGGPALPAAGAAQRRVHAAAGSVGHHGLPPGRRAPRLPALPYGAGQSARLSRLNARVFEVT